MNVFSHINFRQWVEAGIMPNFNIELIPLPRAIPMNRLLDIQDPKMSEWYYAQIGEMNVQSLRYTLNDREFTFKVIVNPTGNYYIHHTNRITTIDLYYVFIMAQWLKMDIQLVCAPLKYSIMMINLNENISKMDEYLAYQCQWKSDFQKVIKQNLEHPYLGKHISNSELPSTKEPLVQVFLSSPKSTNFNINLDFMVKRPDITVIVHGSYLINTCKGDKFGLARSIMEINTAKDLGYQGWIAHIGTKVDLPYDQAKKNMYSYITQLIEYATVDCPLIMETCAGEGGDIMTSPDEILEMLNKFEDPRLKVCIDTCHVFSCGYDPMTFILAIPVERIALIHFNDSQGELFCNRDRHAMPGTGCIGYEKMKEIMDWCIKNQIKMVVE